MPERYSRLGQIVGRHLHVDLVPDANADEVLPHLARDMSQDFVPVGQSHTEHRARQYLGYGAGQFNWFFFRHLRKDSKVYLLLAIRAG